MYNNNNNLYIEVGMHNLDTLTTNELTEFCRIADNSKDRVECFLASYAYELLMEKQDDRN